MLMSHRCPCGNDLVQLEELQNAPPVAIGQPITTGEQL